MLRTRITMHEAIFYRLYKHFRSEKREEFLPVFAFMGEVWCEEVSKWGFVSHEVSARLSELFKGNPGLLQRRMIEGKSGARYFGYRIGPDARDTMIADAKLYEFYKLIKKPKVATNEPAS